MTEYAVGIKKFAKETNPLLKNKTIRRIIYPFKIISPLLIDAMTYNNPQYRYISFWFQVFVIVLLTPITINNIIELRKYRNDWSKRNSSRHYSSVEN